MGQKSVVLVFVCFALGTFFQKTIYTLVFLCCLMGCVVYGLPSSDFVLSLCFRVFQLSVVRLLIEVESFFFPLRVCDCIRG